MKQAAYILEYSTLLFFPQLQYTGYEIFPWYTVAEELENRTGASACVDPQKQKGA